MLFLGVFTHAIQAEVLESEVFLGAKVGSLGVGGRTQTVCMRVLLGGTSRYWAGGRIYHTKMRGKHTSRF